MQKTRNLELPIYDNPDLDVFDLQDWNLANQNIDIAYEEMANFKQDLAKVDANSEIVEARKGKETLGDKISSIDSQLEQITVLASTFGIMANGTDETKKINDFLSYINTRRDIGKIIFPKGTIIINDTLIFKNTLKRKISINGFGTTIKLANQSNNFHNHKAMVYLYNDIDFGGFEFDGNYDNNFIEVDGLKKHAILSTESETIETNKGSIAIILTNADNTKVHDCKFRDISWSSCDIASGNNIEIYNNIFYNGYADYVPVHNATNTKVYNNTLYFPSNHGLHAYSNCSNTVFKDNIIKYVTDHYREYRVPRYASIIIDHPRYPESEVKNTIVENNTIISELQNEVIGIEVIGYPNTYEIKNNNINLLNGNAITIFTQNLGLSTIENNRIYTNGIGIFYKTVNTAGAIEYETIKKGCLDIKNNVINSNANFPIRIDCEYQNYFEEFCIKIENNKYSVGSDIYKFISLSRLDENTSLTINETVEEQNMLDLQFIDLVKGKILFGNNNNNYWFNGDFIVDGINDLDGDKIPALISTRNNGTSTKFEVVSDDLTGIRKLQMNTIGVPTSHSAIVYGINNCELFEGKWINISATFRSLSEHRITIQIVREGEEAIQVSSFNLISRTDYYLDTIVFVPKSKNKIQRKNFKLQILVDVGMEYKKIQYLSITKPSITLGANIRQKELIISDNSIGTINKNHICPLIFYAVRVPEGGSFVIGDICYNSLPSVGAYEKWVCTESGSPGVWKGVNRIS